jgi:hypothetical protein
VLELVREKILEPFPERHDERPHTRPKSFDAVYLVGTRLAVPVATTTDTTEIEIHPDVLFAVGLADTPAAKVATDRVSTDSDG